MRKLNITIPEPCHEDWNTMARTKKGKFCSSCTKEVFDFTHYSDEQLIKRFSKEGDLCGRFTTNQLNRNLVLQRKKKHNYLSYAFTGLLSLLLLNSSSSKAQEKPTTNQTDKKFTSIPLQNTRATDSITATGTVLDETNMPLPGTTVLIKGTTNGTTADFDGKFSLECKETDTLVFSYVGYFTQESLAKKTLSINLNIDNSLEDVVVVAGGIQRKDCSTPLVKKITNLSNKRWIGGNLFTRFTNLFRKNNKNPKYRFN